MKRFIYYILSLFLLFACDTRNRYRIEGKLSNLDNPTLFVVYESSEGNAIDTVSCDEEGRFFLVRERDDDYQAITIYFDGRRQWFTVYPEEGKTIQVKGDAGYPQLIRLKGGRINNKLSEFKKKAAPLYKKWSDMSNQAEEQALTNGDEAIQTANRHYELRGLVQDFVAANPKEEASAILIAEYFTDPEEVEPIEEVLNLLSPELDDFYIVRNLKAQVEKAKMTLEGAVAPNFKVTNIYGQTFTPDSFRNKYYILAFTALWCDMCQTEAMMLDDLVNKYPKDSLDILLVSLDDEFDSVRNMISRDTIAWNLVTDSAGQSIHLFETYNVNSLPKCFLMDKDGKIKLKTTNGEELKQAVDEIINKLK